MTVYLEWQDGLDAPADQAEFITLWDRSWRARGWKTRIVHFSRGGIPQKGKVITSGCRVINFSWRRGRCPVVVAFGTPGWETAALVYFKTEQEALGCGRAIC